MRLKDFDFRIWDSNTNKFIELAISDNIRAIPRKNDDLVLELWSGLYDKNGTKIYDGDIVKNLDSPDLYCVTLYTETGSGEFYVAYIKTPRGLCKECGERLHSIYYWGKYKDNRIECMEVVGNIHLRCEDEKTNL